MEFLTTGNDLMASVGTATGATVTNLLPVVSVVGGIILAFIGVRFILSLIKTAGSKKA